MENNENNIEKPLGDSERRALAASAVKKAAPYFSDDDSLFEFEGFEIEELQKPEIMLDASASEEKSEINGIQNKTETDNADGSDGETVNTPTETADGAIETGAELYEAHEVDEDFENNTETYEKKTASEDTEEDTSVSDEDLNAEAEETDGDGNTEEETDASDVADEEIDAAFTVDTEETDVTEEPYAEERDSDTESTPRSYATEPLSYASDSEKVSAEGQISFDVTETDEASENTETSEENASYGETYGPEEPESDIWDSAGKEEWEAKEAFLSYCKSLTLPPVRSGAKAQAEPESVKQKVNSSGYRYAESERMPVFTDGINGGSDKAGYTEREKRYCENRRASRELSLREATRQKHRTVWYTAAILFIVFVFEIINSAVSGGETVFACLEIGLTLLGAAFVWESLYDSLRCAVKGMFIPELLTFLTVISSVTFNLVTAFSPLAGENRLVIGISGAAAVLFTAVYRCLMAEREKKVFDITSEYGEYCTEVRLASFKGSPEEIAFGGYASDNSSLYKTNVIGRVDGGYNVQPVRDECFGLIKIFIICIVSAAVASGIAFGFINRDAYYGMFSAYLIISLSSPLCVFFSLALSRFMTARSVAEDGAAITDFDEESDELDESVIMLRETELFPMESLNVTDTYWKNSPLLESHLARASVAFKRTGGMLSELFGAIDVNPGDYESVRLTDISDNGITVNVDGVPVRAGDDAYLEKYGIEIERYHDIPEKDTRVLYIANGDEFFARIVIRFVPDAALCRKISELRQSDTLFSLKTCNPCIDPALVFYTTGLEPELLRVVKYKLLDDVVGTATDREGILISKTGVTGLLSAFIGCKRQKRLVLLGSRIAAVAGLVGVLLALAISLVGIKWRLVSFAILGFHLVTSAVAAGVVLYGKGHGHKNPER